jgi:hypothetical protein
LDRFLGLVKLFVVVAGIIIVGGTVALVWLLATRDDAVNSVERVIVESPTASLDAPADAVLDAPAGAVLDDGPGRPIDLPIPPGAIVIDMQMAGSAALLLLRGAEGQEYLATVDLPSGRRRSLLRLVPELP